MKDKIIMTQNTSTYYVWVGGSCDYGHKERVGGAAVVINSACSNRLHQWQHTSLHHL